MNAYETIRFEAKDGIGTLTLNRPDPLNAMTDRMVCETTAALREIARDACVRVLVLTGAGRGFCPGADLKHFTSGDSQADDAIGDKTRVCAEMLERLKKLMGEESWLVEEITFQ